MKNYEKNLKANEKRISILVKLLETGNVNRIAGYLASALTPNEFDGLVTMEIMYIQLNLVEKGA